MVQANACSRKKGDSARHRLISLFLVLGKSSPCQETTETKLDYYRAGSEQLAITLRNLGSRVRHSKAALGPLVYIYNKTRSGVSQGYRTPPSSFVKAQSTGTIFRSMNDTLRHVQTDLPITSAQHSDPSKKRSHSAESDEPDREQELHCSDQPSPYMQTTFAARPIRPLRSSKTRAPSLPTGLLSVATPPHMTETKEVHEEEDWSLNMTPESADQQFDAMEL